MFENGWKLSADGMVVPVWYAGPQLPPSCKKPPRKKASKETDGYEADIEHTSEQKTKSKRKKKTSKTIDEDEEQEKRLKLERKEQGKVWRKNRNSIASDQHHTDTSDDACSSVEETIDTVTEERMETSASEGEAEENVECYEDVEAESDKEREEKDDSDMEGDEDNESIEEAEDDWEHYSEFDDLSDSSGSDWARD